MPPDCLPKAGCGSLYGQFILLWRLLQLIEQLKAFSFPSFYPRYVGAALLIFTVCSFVSMCKHLKKKESLNLGTAVFCKMKGSPTTSLTMTVANV